MKAILTVIGHDKVGIVASVSNELVRHNINILDISQTIMGEIFTMTIICDISKMSDDLNSVKNTLSAKGEELGLQINFQREEIFLAMHQLRGSHL